MNTKGKIFLGVLLVIGFCFYILPNLINQKERDHFSLEAQVERSKTIFNNHTSDSIILPVSSFYDRSKLVRWLFGNHYRDVWTQPVKFPIFKGFDSLHFKKVGGGMQTTSIELKDDFKRSYTLRTLDKDQSRPLPDFLQPSALRPLLRDQTSALNPYAAPVVSELSKALDIWHTHPALYIVPYIHENQDSVELLLSGKAVLFEEELGSKWKEESLFGKPVDIVNTDEMLTMVASGVHELDTLKYLKSRLFDILISDWDRHGGQWKWIIFNDSLTKAIEPFPIDRDMAFSCFDDGVVNSMVIALSNKFKSFRSTKESLLDGAAKISDLDYQLLTDIDKDKFRLIAEEISLELNDRIIEKAFKKYPKPIHSIIGEEHVSVLISRRENLSEAAVQFHQHINN